MDTATELLDDIPVDSKIPTLIAQENIPLVWPLIEPRLSNAMEKLEFVEIDIPSVFNLLYANQAQLWMGGDGEMIAITRIVIYPNVKRLVVDFIEGRNYEHYKEHMEYIEHWAIGLGATQAEAELRPGLEKVAKQEGWRRQRVKMFKHLEKGLH
ncbi:MAG: hypothetical protein O7D34_05305 [Ignavibacteria bacterium]|nr:hypothetical protein [Ignavibacteria bacterium]